MIKKLLLLLLACSLCSVQLSPYQAKAESHQATPAAPAPTIGRAAMQNSTATQWADSVMGTLNQAERIAQLFVYKVAPDRTQANRQLMQRVVKHYKVGGLLFSGGQLSSQAILTNEAQEMAQVPLMITLDGEWGLAMRLKPSPVFPRNRILGNINNDSLLYAYGAEVARQCHEMGISVNFAPVADVDNNPKNPVINTRSFGEDVQRVARQVIAYSRGLQDNGIVAVAKHFPGHGDTDTDSHKALPVLQFDRQRLDTLELIPFKQSIDAGIDGIMVAHLDIPKLTERQGLPSSLSRNIVTNLLTEELHFEGLKFTDALEMKGAVSEGSSIVQALIAGNDLLLVPGVIKGEIENVQKAIEQGLLSMDDIDRRCRKVLMYKYQLGLAQRKPIQISGLEQRINTAQAKQLVEQLGNAAVTVVGNKRGSLPFAPGKQPFTVLNVGNQSAAIASFVAELRRYGQPEVIGLPAQLSAEGQRALAARLSSKERVLIVLSDKNASPYRTFFNALDPKHSIATVVFLPQRDLDNMPFVCEKSDVVVLAHQKTAAVQAHVARMVYGLERANGRLSTSAGPFKAGEGSDYPPITSGIAMQDHRIEFDAAKLSLIDSIANEGLANEAYPGCQVVVLQNGQTVYNKSFGALTYGKEANPVNQKTMYDLASLTKTTATLLAVMKLYDTGKLNLTDRLGDLLPYLKGTDKQHISVKDMLFHESGLPASIAFYEDAIDKQSYPGTLRRAARDRQHSVQIAAREWATPDFAFVNGLTTTQRDNEHPLQVADSLWISASFRQETYNNRIAAARMRPRRYTYSDVNFILLQQIVERKTGMRLDEYVAQEFYRPMGLTQTTYLPLQQFSKDNIAPTASDMFLRKTVLRGFVHDEAAAFQGGVSGNAGLFSTATEVAAVYQLLLNGGEYNGKRYLSQSTTTRFTTEKSRISRRGLGFDKPAAGIGQGPCADSTPLSAYGHTGFTGTCAWVDPDNNLVYVFLSNRVHTRAWNTRLASMRIRPRIQQAIYDAMK